MPYNIRLATTVIAVQCVITLVLSIVVGVMMGLHLALSVMAGGSISLLSNILLSFRIFSGGVKSADKVLQGVYWGGLEKFVLTVMLMAAAIWFLNVSFLALIIAYSIVAMSNWLVLAWIK